MNVFEQQLVAALDRGEQISFSLLGGERAVVAQGYELANSRIADVIARAAIDEWDSLEDPDHWSEFIRRGLESNTDRTVLNAIVDVVAQRKLDGYGEFVSALEVRARERSADQLLRLEATAGIVRLALIDDKWSSSAASTLMHIHSLRDITVRERLCRLTSITLEQLDQPSVRSILEDSLSEPDVVAEASYEVGMLELSAALEMSSPEAIVGGLRDSLFHFERSLEAGEDRRDANIYRWLTRALISLVDVDAALDKTAIQELHREAVISAMWDLPVPGFEWLDPGASAHLEWLPVVDDIVQVASDMRKKSWLDASQVLARVVRLYKSERAVRPGAASISGAVQPSIEASFIQEAGLLNHLDDLLSSEDDHGFSEEDLEQLRRNVERRRSAVSGGKSPGTTSRRRSSRI